MRQVRRLSSRFMKGRVEDFSGKIYAGPEGDAKVQSVTSLGASPENLFEARYKFS